VNKRKDLVDKMIFSHMFCFALDHKPPATVVLIAGDVDYALPLAALGLRKYFIVLVLPPNVKVSQHLQGNAHQVYYWWDVLFPQQPSDQLTAQLRLSASIDKQRKAADNATGQASTSSSIPPPLLSPAAIDPATIDSGGLHLRDLCTVLLNLEEAGDSTPLVSKVGLTLKETFPGLFQKGILPELLEAAELEGLVRIEGQKPRHYCVFDPKVLENYVEG
jgi:hypothetical protein